ERLRSGLVQLDQQSLELVLRCIDFLRECNRRLRAGVALSSAPELLEELNLLGAGSRSSDVVKGGEAAPPLVLQAIPAREPEPSDNGPPVTVAQVPPPTPVSQSTQDFRVVVHFEPELQLADLKAELVLTRLSEISLVRETLPARSSLGNGT